MDPEWKERIARYGYGINVTTALKEDLEEYMETKIYEYIYENFTNYTLWSLFQEEFKGFTIKDFKKICFAIKAKLYTYLLKRGVYITIYNNRYTLSKVLFNLL